MPTPVTTLLIVTVIILGTSLAVAALVELFRPGKAPQLIIDQLSVVLDIYLRWRYPILHKTRRVQLPSCSYRWPNGQGDTGKFMDGIQNSAKWEEQYGSVYRLWSGFSSEIVLTQPHQLRSIFKDSDRHAKAPANNSGHYMNELLGKCVGLISGRQWRSVRSVVEPPFSHQAVMTTVTMVEQHVVRHFRSLRGGGNLSRGLIHPAQDLKMLPFWVVCEMFYGPLPADLTQLLEELAPLRERLFQYVVEGGLQRFWLSRYLPTKANADLKYFQQQWRSFNDAAQRHALSSNPTAPIVSMYAAVQAGQLSSEQLLQTLDESLYANLDVTTGGLSWNLVFLAAHPEIQESVRVEIAAAADSGELHAYLLDSSTLLAACIMESSRLKPLAAFSVPQAAPTDREVDGYIIPAGTSFVIDAYALNVRNQAWSPDNTTYRPTRFVGVRNSDLRYLFWRFGFGARQCMGKHAADLIIRQAIVHLVQNYDLALQDSAAWTRDPKTWITHPDFELLCTERE
ncbi:related to trichodiene oxygenase cytochrome P450 [Ramularia collo-cygni]|uniref:Related to trichodiene oxygenase cytochrome P450 n=1 Tax=Ramularia collo-cygni TaxID=112498 RepID=A0A2D3UNL2_9PEZI|nr:related to trichodiene oxygenase cytochrome P450 [Ramularia collo-cygni]CZT16511.1 related to trichodiene oxygenase cytochrome P450 [Ramularia collo-cygni]